MSKKPYDGVFDLTFQVIGRLHVMEMTKRRDRSGHIIWRCRCECGNPKPVYVTGNDLQRYRRKEEDGDVKGGVGSCGCLLRESHEPQIILTDEQIALYRGGMGCKELGQIAGCSHQGILRALRRQGVAVRKQGRKRLTAAKK